VLINRRKLYSPELRGALNRLQRVREQADYRLTPVTETQAARAVARTRSFVEAIVTRAEGSTVG
jgi:hypothetical protein